MTALWPFEGIDHPSEKNGRLFFFIIVIIIIAQSTNYSMTLPFSSV